MAKKTGRKTNKPNEEKKPAAPGTDPWLSQRTGLIIMAVMSVGLIVLVVVQTSGDLGFGWSLLFGLGMALSLWVVFVLFYAFNKWIRGR